MHREIANNERHAQDREMHTKRMRVCKPLDCMSFTSYYPLTAFGNLTSHTRRKTWER